MQTDYLSYRIVKVNHSNKVLVGRLLLRSGVLKDGSSSHPCANAHGHDAVRPMVRTTQDSNCEKTHLLNKVFCVVKK